MKTGKNFLIILLIFSLCLICTNSQAQSNGNEINKYPVVLDSDTLFFLHTGIGIFSAERRAEEIGLKLKSVSENNSLILDSIKITDREGYFSLDAQNEIIMAVTIADAEYADTTAEDLAEIYRKIIVKKVTEMREIYSERSLIIKGVLSAVYLAGLILFFWGATYAFPWFYKIIRRLDKTKIKDVALKGKEIFKSATIVNSLLILLKGFRFAFSLYAIYLFIVNTIQLWPYTSKWEIQPYLKSISFFIFYTALFFTIAKGINALTRLMAVKYRSWKETKIKSVKIKSVEILSADRTIETLTFITKVSRFGILAILFYIYITIAFSLFTFSETWAATLLSYILTPLKSVITSFLKFLPNLFFIIVLSFVFNYIIKFVKFIFIEIDKGTLELPGFHRDWAIPTFKIIRFLILVLAAIIIFPYLPGSDSPFFQGISVFLGILFSLGSSSAIANMVSGIVLTYMRPFKIGDRVKIAETMGDVIEKTLLVTRIRTPKNVDITIPNAMVLGSHIINFSSSASDKGLILHTTVTIGYDVPWDKVHALLVSAAGETDYTLADPKPFVLQTSLDDFYVSYELNIYTNEPGKMASIYSQLHSKIQDKFNEAGVEIMSPHYSAMRDGNQVAIPSEFIPKTYEAPSFKLFGVNLFGSNKKSGE
ncbi:MAG: mechanosensitive ion channel family protein [Bacteroidetes bacterium]|nr:mechanosensitive ion channel family protein [Bacteroidota bacterium]